MKRLLSLLVVGLPLPVRATDLAPVEAAKIEYLITSISDLRQARFIRNGTPHNAKSAAAHLRLKVKAAGPRIKSAEDFITLCGSASSTTGRPYRIRFSDGREIDAEEYFRQKLAEYAATADFGV